MNPKENSINSDGEASRSPEELSSSQQQQQQQHQQQESIEFMQSIDKNNQSNNITIDSSPPSSPPAPSSPSSVHNNINNNSNSENDEIIKRAAAKRLIEQYFYQLSEGCGQPTCKNKYCASSGQLVKLTPNQAAARAIQLYSQDAELCTVHPSKRSKIPYDDDDDNDDGQQGCSSTNTLHDRTTSDDDPHGMDHESSSNEISSLPTTMDITTTNSPINRSGTASTSSGYPIYNSGSASSGIAGGSTSSIYSSPYTNNTLNNTTSSSSSSSRYPRLSATTSAILAKHNNQTIKNDPEALYLNEIKLNKLIDQCVETSIDTPLIRCLGIYFSSRESLAHSFEKKIHLEHLDAILERAPADLKTIKKEDIRMFEGDMDKDEDSCAEKKPLSSSLPHYTSVDLISLRRTIKKLQAVKPNTFESLNNALNRLGLDLTTDIRFSTDRELFEEIITVFVIAFEVIMIGSAEFFDVAIPSICKAATHLPVWAQGRLAWIWAVNCKNELNNYIQVLQQLISIQVITGNYQEESFVQSNATIVGATKVLKIIYYANMLAADKRESPKLRADDDDDYDVDVDDEVTEGNDDGGNTLNSLPGPSSASRSITTTNGSGSASGSGGAAAASGSGTTASGGGGGTRQRATPIDFEPLTFAYKFNKSKLKFDEDPLALELNINVLDCPHPFLPYEEFYNEPLSDVIRMENDYLIYKKGVDSRKFSFMLHAFILTPATKTMALCFDSRIRMYNERCQNIIEMQRMGQPANPYLKLRVRRSHIIEDALIELEVIAMASPKDLKKQLVVEFIDEQGIDEGGVSKEFFQLVVENIFNPDFGMFIHKEDTNTNSVWFNSNSFENEAQFTLIGIVLGLAIYNNIILAVNFPMVVYKKLMGIKGSFIDLKDWDPVVYRNMNELLEYVGDDIEEVFVQTFKITYHDVFGNTLTHELKPNGDNIMVNQENKQEFVNLYTDYLLNSSINKQFKAFKRGFQMVTDESPLHLLFRPDEIELIVCGSKEFDFNELEKSTEYDGGYTETSQIIIDFWHIVHNLSLDSKKKLLEFTTGSDRVPVGGLSRLKLIIARNGPDCDRLPTSHTCFNILLLPEYSSKEKLEDRLLKAINYSKGFGML